MKLTFHSIFPKDASYIQCLPYPVHLSLQLLGVAWGRRDGCAHNGARKVLIYILLWIVPGISVDHPHMKDRPLMQLYFSVRAILCSLFGILKNLAHSLLRSIVNHRLNHVYFPGKYRILNGCVHFFLLCHYVRSFISA